jgi:hypothetical protein
LAGIDKPAESEQNKNNKRSETTQGDRAMLTMTATMFAFAGVYALIATMVGDHRGAIAVALGATDRRQAEAITAASRCLNRA